MSGFDCECKKVFGESSEDFRNTDEEQWCVADHFFQAGRADRQQQDAQIAMDAASHSVADIAKAQAISDLIAEAK